MMSGETQLTVTRQTPVAIVTHAQNNSSTQRYSMYVCVCMYYVCMCVCCMYVCMYVCMLYVCVYVCMYVCMYADC